MELENVLSELNLSLFEEIKAQLRKDIEMSGLKIQLDTTSPKILLDTLIKFVENENKNNPKALMNLLYRVDLKESEIQKIATKLNLSFEESIVVGLLKRTIEKVKFRKKFNN